MKGQAIFGFVCLPALLLRTLGCLAAACNQRRSSLKINLAAILFSAGAFSKAISEAVARFTGRTKRVATQDGCTPQI